MVGIISDKGIVRSLNEDYANYVEAKEYRLYVVADGMGGHNAGEVASKIAVDTIVEYIDQSSNCDDALKEAVLKANKNIYSLSHTEKSYSGMGTTITACLITESKIEIANVGDSCCFGIKDNNIIKITKDHSLVQELIDSGSITEEEGENHPKKNIITRALGTTEVVKVDIYSVKDSGYNMFLLCSDGLTNEVSKKDIMDIITGNDDYSDICKKLVSLAKERGGRDNITVLLFGGEV